MLQQDMLQRFKTVDQQFQTLMEYIKNEAEETRRHFNVVAENIHHDMLKGALNDKVEQHEDRIQLLEQHAGLAAV